MLHPDATAFAVSADTRHVIVARPSSSGTEFTLYAHHHG
jgi:hypothetical protein